MPLKEFLSGLSPNIKGALWMVGGAFSFCVMNAMVKGLGQNLPSIEVVFFRCLFQLVLLLPVIVRMGGLKFLKTDKYKLYALRLGFGITNMIIFFYVVTQIPYAMAVTISFSRPLFIVVFAIPLLAEICGMRRGLATLVGFTGILIVARPEAGQIEPAAIWAVCAAMCLALTHIFIKKLSRTEHPLAMISWFSIVATIISLAPTLNVWVAPTLREYVLLFVLAGMGLLGQFCTIRAYFNGEATVVAPFDYLQILFAGLIGFFFFGEMVDGYTVLGACIIVGSSFYILKREAVVKPKETPNVTPPPGGELL